MRARACIGLFALVAGLAGCGGGDSDPAAEAPAVVWAVGDAATGSSAARALAARIAEDEPARLLYLGDVYPDGTQADFAERYDPAYGRLARVTEPTPGNHEWGTRTEGYGPYWKRRKGRALPGAYDFELAGWQILSLNSEGDHGPDSDQVRWLRDRVREPGTWSESGPWSPSEFNERICQPASSKS